MLDPEKRAMIDQNIAEIAEGWPTVWHKLYLGCVEEGFTELQAMELVKAFIAKPL